MEIFTISGPPDSCLQGDCFGDAALDQRCAQNIKSLVIAGGAARIGAVPVALFGTYKLLKTNWAAGVVSLLGAAVLWGSGGRLIRAAALSFQQCRGSKP